MIFKYTLIARKPVIVNDVDRSFKLYDANEASKEANRELKRALLFHILGTASIKSFVNDAHSYFLAQNAFVVSNKGGSNSLVETIKNLSSAENPACVHNLQVTVPCNPDIEEVENLGRGLRMPDFEPDDKYHPGLCAYRILKPLLNLKWLQNMVICLKDNYNGNRIFEGFGTGATNPIDCYQGLPMIAAVVAKLMDLVFASNPATSTREIAITGRGIDITNREIVINCSGYAPRRKIAITSRGKFCITRQRVNFPRNVTYQMGAKERNISALWYPLSHDEKWRLGPLIFGRPVSKSLVPDYFGEEVPMPGSSTGSVTHFHAAPEKFSQEQPLWDRYHVGVMASDPNWEVKVEALAKGRSVSPSEWFYC